jgi:hypothetical protein
MFRFWAASEEFADCDQCNTAIDDPTLGVKDLMPRGSNRDFGHRIVKLPL